MLKSLVIILSLVVFAPAQNCQNPGWGERCSVTFNDCITGTSEGEGCEVLSEGCQTCYRADLLLSGFTDPNADYTVGTLVYIRRGVQGWRITKLGRLAGRGGIEVGDIVTRIGGLTVTRGRLLAHFAKARAAPYAVRIFKVRTGRTLSLRIN